MRTAFCLHAEPGGTPYPATLAPLRTAIPQVYLLLGYGSSLQYDDVDRAAADLGELLGAVQQRTQGRVRRLWRCGTVGVYRFQGWNARIAAGVLGREGLTRASGLNPDVPVSRGMRDAWSPCSCLAAPSQAKAC